jgi:hypothetical protein
MHWHGQRRLTTAWRIPAIWAEVGSRVRRRQGVSGRGQRRLRDSRSVTDLIDRLAAVWTQVQTGDARDEAAFREVYTDPVILNGSGATISELVERYRTLHASFTDLDIEVLDRTELPGTLAVVLRQRGRHVGPLPTALGTVEPTGRTFDVMGIDVLTVRDERIGRIWVVADELGGSPSSTPSRWPWLILDAQRVPQRALRQARALTLPPASRRYGAGQLTIDTVERACAAWAGPRTAAYERARTPVDGVKENTRVPVGAIGPSCGRAVRRGSHRLRLTGVIGPRTQPAR